MVDSGTIISCIPKDAAAGEHHVGAAADEEAAAAEAADASAATLSAEGGATTAESKWLWSPRASRHPPDDPLSRETCVNSRTIMNMERTILVFMRRPSRTYNYYATMPYDTRVHNVSPGAHVIGAGLLKGSRWVPD